jgi:hypothetical protein
LIPLFFYGFFLDLPACLLLEGASEGGWMRHGAMGGCFWRRTDSVDEFARTLYLEINQNQIKKSTCVKIDGVTVCDDCM